MLVSTIAYGHLRDDSRRDVARAHVRAARAGRTPFWRRELHLFPRREREGTIARAQTEQSSTEASSAHAEPKVPWYKREIGPSKKSRAAKQQAKAAKREAEAAAKQQAKADKEHAKAEKKRAKAENKHANVPWYKREIGGKKRSEPAEIVEESHEPAADEPTPLERILAATESTATWHPVPQRESEPAEAAEPETNETDPWSAVFGDTVVDDEASAAPGVEPAPEPEPLAEAPKVPWYKREIGPSKESKAAKQQAKAAKREADAAAKQQAQADKEHAKAEKQRAKAEKQQAKVPWYKREIGGKKRDNATEVVEEAQDLPADEPTPVERIVAATESSATWQPAAQETSEPPQAVEPEANPADPWNAFFGDAVVTDAASASASPTQADEVDESPEPLAEASKVPWYKREIGSSKESKAAKKESRAAERQAKVDAKQQAKDDKERAKAEKKQAEIAERDAKTAAKQQRKADKERAKAEQKQANSQVPWYKRELGRPKRSSQGRDTRKQHARRGGGRKQRIVGLKIGASQLAAARISNNGSAELVQLARANLQRGVVVGGELRDPESLTTALKKFFRDNKLPRQGVRLGIGSNRIGVRVFEIAGVEDRTLLDNAVRFKAQEFLPIPLEQAVLDYHVVDEHVDDEGRVVHRVLVAFAYRELVDRYVEACRRAGIRLSGIDLEAFALLRALGAPEPAEAPQRDAAVIAVAIGHDRSTLAVSDGRICEFTRILEWGGFQLDVAVSRVLDVTPSEAEAVKREVDLTMTDVVIAGLSAERSQEVRDAVRRQVELLARELVSSLQFYQSQPGSLGVGEIVVTGGTAQLRGLDAELQRLIGVKVRLGDPFARVKVGRRVKAAEQLPSLAVAIGLGIED